MFSEMRHRNQNALHVSAACGLPMCPLRPRNLHPHYGGAILQAASCVPQNI